MIRIYAIGAAVLVILGLLWAVDHLRGQNELLEKDVKTWEGAYKVAADIAVENKEAMEKMAKEQHRTGVILANREKALNEAERKNEEQHAAMEELKRKDKDAERWLDTPVPDSVRNLHRAGRPAAGSSGEAVPAGEPSTGHTDAAGKGPDQR